MVKTQNEALGCFAFGEARSHERWLREIEPQRAIRPKVGLELTFFRALGQATPVHNGKRNHHVAMHDLNRLAQPFPDKRRSQYRMPRYHSLPGSLERC